MPRRQDRHDLHGFPDALALSSDPKKPNVPSELALFLTIERVMDWCS